jgi:flagellar motor switch protein FliN/FliY
MIDDGLQITGAVPAEVALQPLDAGMPVPTAPAGGLELVLDVPVELSVEVGRTSMTIREVLGLGPGSIVELDRMTGEPVDLFVNGRRIARGEVVAIDEEFGLRITEVVSGGPPSRAAAPPATLHADAPPALPTHAPAPVGVD